MGKGKRVRSKQHKIDKMTKKVAKNHQETTTIHRKELSHLCNQWTYGHIGPKRLFPDK